jgi:hypothetical protein
MVNREIIKVGFCVAYDWYLLKYSLPLIYEHADRICLSVDNERRSWSGVPYSWDEEGFRALIAEIDHKNKIEILEENYHLSELAPMANEVRQRNMIAEYFGPGGWHVQLDTDEFFLNFKGFIDHLQTITTSRPVNVVCPWITLYKQTKEGFFYVQPGRFNKIEFMQIATRLPAYEYGRRNGNFNIFTDFAILHLSWARSEEEIWEKINNWGHRDDFDIASYFEKWKNLSVSNYQEYADFHYRIPQCWPTIGFIGAEDLESLIEVGGKEVKLPIGSNDIRFKNNIWLSRLRALSRELKKKLSK